MADNLLFDKLCKIADSKASKEIVDLVQESRLFLFDIKEAGLTLENLPEMAKLSEDVSVVFPFDMCAIETTLPKSAFEKLVMVVKSSEKEALANVSSIDCFVHHGSRVPGMEHDLVYHFKAQYYEYTDIMQEFKSLLTGEVQEPEKKCSIKIADEFGLFAFVDGKVKCILKNLNEPEFEFLKNQIQDLVDYINMWLRLFIVCVSTPKNFILEEVPKGFEKVAAKNKKALRTHQRPLYTILRPFAIREKLGLKTPVHEEKRTATGRKSPTPHERRRHTRRISSAGGHFKQDKEIVIEATWIGPSEAVVGNKRYKVRLDL